MRTKALVSLIAGLALIGVAFGQTLQMTGKVLAVTNSSITVQKGTEVWQIARASSTTTTGDLKVGATVTINCAAPDAQKKESPDALPGPSAAEK